MEIGSGAIRPSGGPLTGEGRREEGPSKPEGVAPSVALSGAGERDEEVDRERNRGEEKQRRHGVLLSRSKRDAGRGGGCGGGAGRSGCRRASAAGTPRRLREARWGRREEERRSSWRVRSLFRRSHAIGGRVKAVSKKRGRHKNAVKKRRRMSARKSPTPRPEASGIGLSGEPGETPAQPWMIRSTDQKRCTRPIAKSKPFTVSFEFSWS